MAEVEDLPVIFGNSGFDYTIYHELCALSSFFSETKRTQLVVSTVLDYRCRAMPES